MNLDTPHTIRFRNNPLKGSSLPVLVDFSRCARARMRASMCSARLKPCKKSRTLDIVRALQRSSHGLGHMQGRVVPAFKVSITPRFKIAQCKSFSLTSAYGTRSTCSVLIVHFQGPDAHVCNGQALAIEPILLSSADELAHSQFNVYF